jgi:hypothetical protein
MCISNTDLPPDTGKRALDDAHASGPLFVNKPARDQIVSREN